MLTSEDRDLLGMMPEVYQRFRKDNRDMRPSSAVSQILRAMTDDLLRGPAEWDLDAATEVEHSYRMFVAADRTSRRRAYALAHRVYHGRGYVPAGDEIIVSPFDSDPNTLTLLATDEIGREAATITLVFDGNKGLPCDEIYATELNALRAQRRRLVEVTRLAIDEKHQRSKVLLLRLFNFIYIFAHRVKGFDDFVIEVNPRHVNYYRRLLLFEEAGPQRPCPRVQGAPAQLLRLDLSIPAREVRRIGGKTASANDRTLYPNFYSWLEEGAVAEFLARSHAPMTAEDALHFGLKHPLEVRQ